LSNIVKRVREQKKQRRNKQTVHEKREREHKEDILNDKQNEKEKSRRKIPAFREKK